MCCQLLQLTFVLCCWNPVSSSNRSWRLRQNWRDTRTTFKMNRGKTRSRRMSSAKPKRRWTVRETTWTRVSQNMKNWRTSTAFTVAFSKRRKMHWPLLYWSVCLDNNSTYRVIVNRILVNFCVSINFFSISLSWFNLVQVSIVRWSLLQSVSLSTSHSEHHHFDLFSVF